MATRNLSIRLSVKDAETVKRALQQLGADGDKALKRIEKSSKPASKGLLAINAASRETQDRMQGLADRGGILGAALSRLGPAGIAAAAGLAVVTAAAIKAIKEFAAVEQAQIRLEAVLKATGNAAGITGQQLASFAEELERATLFSAEQIREAEAAMLTFKSVTGETFFQAIKLAGDLSATFGGDLNSSVLQLGKALEDPINGLSALRRVGVSFTANQRELIESLVESGEIMKAQGVILEALEGQVGGVAKQLGTQGMAAAFDQAKDAAGDFFEELGARIADTGIVQSALNGITSAIDGVTNAIKRSDSDDGGLNGSTLDAMKRVAEEARQEARRAAKAEQEHADAISNVMNNLEKERELLKLSTRERAIQEQSTKIITEQRKSGIKLTDDEIAAIKKGIAANYDLEQSQRGVEKAYKKANDSKKDSIEKLGIEVGQLARQAKANIESEASLKAVNNQIEIENELRQAGLSINSKEGQHYATMLKQRQQLKAEIEDTTEERKKEQEAIQKSIEEQQRAAEQFAENIQNALADGFENIFTNIEDGFKSVFENMKRFAIRTLAEIAAQKVVVQILPAISGGMISSAASASTGGGGGGIGGLSNLSSLSNLLPSNMTSGLSSITSGITGGINSFGASLGFGGVSPSFVGPLMPGTGVAANAGALTGASLSSVLGVGSLGFMGGGMLAGALGMNQTGGSIGGGLGAAAGFALGGPVGALIGGGLGSLAGGMFGGKPGVVASEFDSTTGGATTFRSKRSDTSTAKSIASALQQFTSALEIGAGVSLAQGTSIRGGYNSRRGGGFIESGGKMFNFNPEDAASMEAAIIKLNVELLKSSDTVDKKLKTALQNLQVEGKSAAQIIEELAIASGKAAKDFNAMISREIKSIVDPAGLALDDLNVQFKELRAQAKKVGGDLAKVEELYNLKRSEILKQQNAEQIRMLEEQGSAYQQAAQKWQQYSASLQKFQQSLLLDKQLSILSPAERYNEASRQFQDVQRRAALGDETAIGQLEDVSRSFLESSRDFYASSEQYARDFDLVQKTLVDTKALTDRQANIQLELSAKASQQIELLSGIKSALESGAGGSSNRLLRPGESSSSLEGINATNNLPISTVRKIKESLGFDFSAAENQGITFADYVRKTGGDIGDRFNAAIKAAGGVTQKFADGGMAQRGLALVGERGPEIVQFSQPARVYNANDTRRMLGGNDNAAVVVAINSLQGEFRAYRQQSATETVALVKEISQLKAENADLKTSMQRLASK